MKAIIQRASSASVAVNDRTVGKIEQGFVVLLGIGEGDTKKDADWILNKIVNMRIFTDDDGKFNLSLLDVVGNLLVVSQFTLYGNCKKGNRPSFVEAAKPEKAKELYNYFIQKAIEKIGLKVQTGIFAADMKVSLVNDGPVTISLDTQL